MTNNIFKFPKKETPRVEKLLGRLDVSFMELVKLFQESEKHYKTSSARLNWIEKQIAKKTKI